MAALAAEISIAAGAQALQALLTCVREGAGTRAAREAEKGRFTRLLPSGLAAMTRSCIPRGTGEVGPAITRPDGVVLARESTRRRRDDVSLVGTFAVARTCERRPGAPGIFPLDAQVTRPERCDADVLPAWMPVFAVAPPVKARASWFAPRFDRDIAERVWRAVAQEAPEADEGC